jgi:hypothetical protein
VDGGSKAQPCAVREQRPAMPNGQRRKEFDMGTLIYKAMLWLAWQGMKAIHILLKSEKMETTIIRPMVEAVV